MGFKLGSKPYPIASGGTITNKFGFKIKRGVDLEDGVLGEAHPGEVHISKEVEEGSALEKRVINHEGDHVKRMRTGESGFDDDHVEWRGKKYERKDGKIFYEGEWYEEGDKELPWEAAAIKAENK